MSKPEYLDLLYRCRECLKEIISGWSDKPETVQSLIEELDSVLGKKINFREFL